MDIVEFEVPASRAALMDRYFEDSWTIHEDREWFELCGWVRGLSVRVTFRGLKGELPGVVLAFFGALDGLSGRE